MNQDRSVLLPLSVPPFTLPVLWGSVVIVNTSRTLSLGHDSGDEQDSGVFGIYDDNKGKLSTPLTSGPSCTLNEYQFTGLGPKLGSRETEVPDGIRLLSRR